ncbi:unnamed protein product [Ceutorhynchus assimilis]|uniref:Putative inorganic phosphate cotransporter n=1 Tax=Ceutorhynchus assimilis TaxID=467358 RepID=A0A9N9MNE8_9CUCU|nr:unnamed protein product [Ceutorhynchus assimilis]
MGQEQKMECSKENTGPRFGKRHIQAILLFTAIAAEIMTRTSLSLSIVAMTDNSTSSNPNIPTYHWSDTNIILSSFFWGYFVLQVLAGEIAKNYGAKWFLFGAMFCNGFTTMLIPLAAELFGSKGVMACRILQGLCQGGVYPCCHTMLGRWAATNERGKMSTFVYSGISAGSIICLPITGLISESDWGWPATFYVFGSCGVIWSIVWFFFGQNSPATHPAITPEERRYIEVSLNQDKDTKNVPTPWKEMFSSIHFWAMAIPTICTGYGIIFLQTEIPTYLKQVLNQSNTSSGFLTAMTYAVGVLVTWIYGPLSDFLIERQILSRTNTRKCFEAFSCYGSAASMLILISLGQEQTGLATFMITMSAVFGAAIFFGHGVNAIDMSPRFSGIILGFANSVSCLAAMAGPLSVQFFVKDETNAKQWRLVFIIASFFYVIPATFFLIFASGERQWWDDGAEKTDLSEKEMEDRKLAKV